MNFTVLYCDEHLVAVHKPAGFHVHPPEDGHLIPDGVNCLKLLKKQVDRYLYPVHRLDRATSGVLLFALTPEAAREIQRQFDAGSVVKSYFCVVRGWPAPEGLIDSPLVDGPARRRGASRGLSGGATDRTEPLRPDFAGCRSGTASASGGPPTVAPGPVMAARTAFRRLACLELPIPLPPHPTVRYALLQVNPQTGRWHQIRRHLARHDHPVAGDVSHGDRRHNHLFASELKLPGLLLKAHAVTFCHPATGDRVRVVSPWKDLWHRVFDVFGLCPWGDGKPGLHPERSAPV